MTSFSELKIIEIIRAGDSYLFKHKCPECKSDDLTGFPAKHCSTCKVSYEGLPFDFENATWRILAGSKRKQGSRFPKKLIQFLRDMQSGQCAYCDCQLENYHVEHIIPLAAGGTNAASNLCLACPPCNGLAGSKYFGSYALKRTYLINRRKSRAG